MNRFCPYFLYTLLFKLSTSAQHLYSIYIYTLFTSSTLNLIKQLVKLTDFIFTSISIASLLLCLLFTAFFLNSGLSYPSIIKQRSLSYESTKNSVSDAKFLPAILTAVAWVTAEQEAAAQETAGKPPPPQQGDSSTDSSPKEVSSGINNSYQQGQKPPGFLQILPELFPMFLLVFIIFHFMVLKPQQIKLKEQQKLLDAIKKGDSVVTSSGIVGKVVSKDENYVFLEIANNVKVKFDKFNIARLDKS
jgi:preprotein translocase subunit YajC